ncbi:MAG: gliding motility-associated C-terminal domain-containing protein [Schleiferiaceae bacterium]
MRRVAVFLGFLLLGLTSVRAQVLEKPAPLIIPNGGQWPSEVLASVNVGGARVWVLADGLRFMARTPGESDSVAVWTERYVGAHGGHLELLPTGPATTFALGRSRPVTVRGAEHAWLRNVYPGIDLELRVESGQFKTWWQGAGLERIEVAFEGATARRADPTNLEVHTPAGTAVLRAPVAFDAQGRSVKPKWVPRGANWTLVAPGAVRIDPTYVFSSFSGSVSDNFGYTATYDLKGRTWLGGVAFGAQYPTQNGVQANFGGGGVDMALMLFNPSGTGIVSATYLGGSGMEQPHSLRVAPNGDLVLKGVTNSINFPVSASGYDTSMAVNTGAGTQNGGGVFYSSATDLALVRLDSTGSSLKSATYYGRLGYDGLQDASLPHYGDPARGDIWVDNQGIWIATASRSRGMATWPLDTSRGGAIDGLLAHFSPNLDSLRWATYLGGPDLDGLTSLVPTPTAQGMRLAVVGWTQGMGTLSGTGVFTTPVPQSQAYYALLHPQTGQRLAETYLQPQFCTSYGFLAAQNPAGAFAAVGDSGAVLLSLGLGTSCVGGGGYSGPLAPTPGLWQTPNSTQIMCWISALGDSIYRTQYVGNGQLNRRISPTALQVDECGSAYFSGWFGGLNGGTITGLYTTPNAAQPTTDGRDFYFLVVDRRGAPAYASYFGGTGPVDEHVDGGTSRFDPNGVIHQAICAGCGGSDNLPIFPPNAHSAVNNSSNCNMAGVQIAFELLEAKVDLALSADTLCAGDSLRLQGTWSRVDQLNVNWGNGVTWSGAPDPLPSLQVLTPGTFVVTVLGLDTLCLTQAQQSFTVHVLPGTSVQADATLNFDPCDPTRTLSLSPGPNLNAQWLVLYGVNGSVDSILPPYSWTGTALTNSYSAWLVAYDNVCGRRDSSFLQAEFRPPLSTPGANVTAPNCLDGSTVRALGIPGNATASYWRVPGGGVIQGFNVQWTPTSAGTQTAWFVVADTVCGTKDSVQVSYQIFGEDLDSLTLPNVFTPNGDGVNDHFSLRSAEAPAVQQLFLKVYDRWGQEVFRTSDPNFAWDGRYLNRLLSPGVYLYHATWQSACGGSGDQHGTLTLNL